MFGMSTAPRTSDTPAFVYLHQKKLMLHMPQLPTAPRQVGLNCAMWDAQGRLLGTRSPKADEPCKSEGLLITTARSQVAAGP